MNFRQRAAAWKQAKLDSRKPAPKAAPKPVVEQEEIELMEDAAEALEAEEKATKKRRWGRKKKD